MRRRGRAQASVRAERPFSQGRCPSLNTDGSHLSLARSLRKSANFLPPLGSGTPWGAGEALEDAPVRRAEMEDIAHRWNPWFLGLLAAMPGASAGCAGCYCEMIV